MTHAPKEGRSSQKTPDADSPKTAPPSAASSISPSPATSSTTAFVTANDLLPPSISPSAQSSIYPLPSSSSPYSFNGEDRLIPPFSWLFSGYRTALLANVLIPLAGWLLLLAARRNVWPADAVYWNEEIPVLVSFMFAAILSLLLSSQFQALRKRLTGVHPEVDLLLAEQNRQFHGAGLLVIMPLVVSTIAISIRYISAGYLNPYVDISFDYAFCSWLWIGFCYFLNTLALCGRYSEIIRRLGEAAEKGFLRRRHLFDISSFYLRVAMLVSVLFALGAITVYSLNIIYGFNGSNWPLVAMRESFLGGQYFFDLFHRPLKDYFENPIYIELTIFLLLNGIASFGAAAYFIVPQWGIHRMLKRRKEAARERIDELLENGETEVIARPGELSFEKFTRYTLMKEAIDQMPEWPFQARGALGTILLFGIPGLLVFLKEIFLNIFANVLTK
ncbi:MAG: hypothetical protein WA705_24555 [Candidatus Ozemobacteraceae bacterium]